MGWVGGVWVGGRKEVSKQAVGCVVLCWHWHWHCIASILVFLRFSKLGSDVKYGILRALIWKILSMVLVVGLCAR
ncbi:hypothetical protein B0T19DRAFT_417306 [Cercophora scortea]|uniref:Transmembrane protein n=1 Tax=Cercophora scortea TaxID=314031 RepID=A0AAE0IZ07_9PEZI|nr:hypothetical protein B0T19DRAFT_417306 [Cercophora scortea]